MANVTEEKRFLEDGIILDRIVLDRGILSVYSNNNTVPDIDIDENMETFSNYGDNDGIISPFTLDSNDSRRQSNQKHFATLEDI